MKTKERQKKNWYSFVVLLALVNKSLSLHAKLFLTRGDVSNFDIRE